MRISDWSSDVCSSDLARSRRRPAATGTVESVVSCIFPGLQSPPSAAGECFQRPEAALVIHLAVALDPVAHVQVVQALVARPRDLPQDREGAQAPCGFARILEGVHGRDRKSTRLNSSHSSAYPMPPFS